MQHAIEGTSQRMRISIFGIGYVGAVSSGCLSELGHSVVGVDVSPEKVAMLSAGQSPIVEAEIGELIATNVAKGQLTATTDVAEAIASSDISFIAVGTPSAADGSVSLRAIDAVLASIGTAIAAKSGQHTVVMRSTVPPGTAETRAIPALEASSGRTLGQGLHYYSNPEFLREGTAVRDFHAPAMTLIGAPEGDDAPVLRQLYAPISAPVQVVPYKVAESAKHLSNVYHAVKLAFANEAGAVLAAMGVDAREAFRIFCEDRILNVSAAYLRPGFAFGGSCLPKDTRSFLALADQHGIAAPFLQQVLPSNNAVVERAFAAITAHGRKKVAMFGLAFKSGTDDLRESPYVALTERLIGRGYDLRIFDRSVNVATLLGANRSYIEREIPHIERLMAKDVADAVADAGIIVIGHVAGEDRRRLLEALDGQVVIDLAGISALASHEGIIYQGLCW
jgi:GDP-mannose 6-dehydrogenase